jgi:subtilase family serine protease
VEQLEGRWHLSVARGHTAPVPPTLTAVALSHNAFLATIFAHPDYRKFARSTSPDASPGYAGGGFNTPAGNGYTPAQMQGAYGVNNIVFGTVKGDGSGQTIAIVDAYDYSTALNDVNAFSAAFDLPSFNNGGGSPTFTKYNEYGSTTALPGNDPAGAGNDDWEMEESLDIEWAHAMAPKANIDLVEANS